jgi:hypothetical protein
MPNGMMVAKAGGMVTEERSFDNNGSLNFK